MTSDRELMRIHVEALFAHDAAGRLVRVNEPDGRSPPVRDPRAGRPGAMRTSVILASRVARRRAAVPTDDGAGSSFRRTSMAHEAGVETAPPYRGCGYAVQVVRAWARAIRDMNRIPLYSTSWRNEASRAVARKLALICFGRDLHIT